MLASIIWFTCPLLHVPVYETEPQNKPQCSQARAVPTVIVISSPPALAVKTSPPRDFHVHQCCKCSARSGQVLRKTSVAKFCKEILYTTTSSSFSRPT